MTTLSLSSEFISSFVSAESSSQRAKLLQSHAALHTPDGVRALCDQASHWARSDLNLAREAAEAALRLAEAIAASPEEALAHRTLANILAALARPSLAFTHYTNARTLFKALGDPHQEAITRSSALQVMLETEGPDTALSWASEARQVFLEAGDHLRLARLENNLAVLFFRQEDFYRAYEHWQAAHSTLQTIGEPLDEATTLRNLAVCSISLNRPSKAKNYYRQARKLAEDHDFSFLLHSIDYNIAYLYFLEGNHHRALQLYKAARQRSRELGDSYHEAYCSLDETEIYIELNLLSEAETVAQLAASQFREQERPYEEAKAMYNLALIRSRRGESREALSHLDAASKAILGQGNILWPGQVELLRASVYSADGRFFEASRSAHTARTLFKRSGLLRRASIAELLLAKVRLLQGLFSEAEALCRTALRDLESAGEPSPIFQAHFLLGRILEAQGESAPALQCFRHAEQYLLELRERRAVSRTGVSVVDQPLELYADLVALLLGDSPEVALSVELFRLVGTAKTRSFADVGALSTVRTPSPTKMRSQLVDQVSRLRQELNWLYRRIDRSELPDAALKKPAIEALHVESESKETELASALSQLHAESPGGADDLERVGAPSIDAVLAKLRGHVLIEYFVAHDVTMAAVLSADTRKFLPVAVTSTVRDLQRKLWYYLHYSPQREAIGQDPAASALHRILNELYLELVAPLEDYLSKAPLLIAPHSFLFLLPFHAFHTGEEHLIERAPVSYVTTAADLMTTGSHDFSKEPGYGVVGFHQELEEADVFPDRLRPVLLEQLDGAAGASDSQSRGDMQGLSALHLIAQAQLREDNPLFSNLQIGTQRYTFLDFYRSSVFSPLLTIEGGGFAPATPNGHAEVSATWRALLVGGAQAATVPAGSSRVAMQRDYARIFYLGVTRGLRANIAHQAAVLELRRCGVPLHEWASLFLIGDPLLQVNSEPA